MMVPIEAPPFSGLRVNYNIFKGHDQGFSQMLKRVHVDCKSALW
jgi:hypothetical protein